MGNIKLHATISTVAINPVTQGSGTSLKILDYLMHNWPVISTEFGMRGYHDLRPFVTISDLDGFADTILRGQSLPPAEAAKALKRYLWANSALKMKDIYLSLLENRSGEK